MFGVSGVCIFRSPLGWQRAAMRGTQMQWAAVKVCGQLKVGYSRQYYRQPRSTIKAIPLEDFPRTRLRLENKRFGVGRPKLDRRPAQTALAATRRRSNSREVAQLMVNTGGSQKTDKSWRYHPRRRKSTISEQWSTRPACKSEKHKTTLPQRCGPEASWVLNP